ncbi:MAG: intradiol ring-cleavage dioxygenase [Caldilineaceae bacterium]
MSQVTVPEQPDNDDEPVGRVWSRRELLGLLAVAGGSLTLAACAPGALQSPAAASNAAAGTASGAATAAPAAAVESATAPAAAQAVAVDCVVSPEQGQGPFFVDNMLNRSDIRSDPGTGEMKQGALLALALGVAQVANGACTPLSGALVDIWHCDADGVYSAFNDGRVDARNECFLRGQQVTDESGVARFTTIYPGWYPGRTVHIHIKVRSAAEGGNTWDFTSQLYFDDAFTDQVFAAAPYAERGLRSTRNQQDGIFARGGDQMIMPVLADGEGYAGRYTVGLAI